VRRFVFVIYAATAVGHIPFAIGLRYALASAGVPAAGWFSAVAAVLLLGALRPRLQLARWDRPIPRWRRLLVEEPYFAHWFAAILTVPAFLVALLIAAVRALSTGGEIRLGALALGVYLASLAVAIWAVFVRRRWVRVRNLDVVIEGLGAAFDGFRIAQLSDLHIGSMSPRECADRWVRLANALDVDLVALTGDYVTSGVQFHADIAGALAGLRAREAVVAVMGNHDYFGDGEPLITLLREGGIRVLRNERMELSRGRDTLVLAGVDDTWTRRTDIPRTLDGFAGDSPLVVLAHDPKLFPELARRGAALVLSGHTHWGQIAIPFLAARLNLSAIRMRFTAGLYKEGRSTLYVNPGLGTTGPPVRIGAPPEITVFRLRAA